MLHTEFLLSQRPGVTNARGAKEWIKELPVTDARAAHHAVSGLLAELEDSTLPALDRLEILETLRANVAEIDRLYSGRYVAKPLPLGPTERNAFAHAKHLWLRLEGAYWHCANAALSGDETMQSHLALCLARAAGVACASLAGHVRAGQAPDPAVFDSLQNYFELAQDSRVLTTPVQDSLHPKRGTSVAATYRRALLIRQGAGAAAAGRERECMIDLAEAWEGKTTMAWRPAGRAAPTAADLPPAADGAKQCVKLIPAGRWLHMLDVTLVSRSLRRRLHKIALGAKPEELRLPPSFQSAGADDLLKRLHSAWCEESNGRSHSRLAAKPGASHGNRVTLAHAVTDFAVLYCMATGEAFVPDDKKDQLLDRRHAEEIFMFQHVARAKTDAAGVAATRQFEDWELLDESASGFRLRRASAGARLRRGQLLALRPGAGSPVLLAEIRWLTEPELALDRSAPGDVPGAVEAGLHILHGKLAGIGLRATGINSQGGRGFTPAFLLRVAHAGESGFRVVAPVGWFKQRRIVEVRDGEKNYRMMFEKLLQRGVDFEVVEAYMTN